MVPGSGDELISIVRDFTDQRRLERELARRLQDVQHEQTFTRTVVNTAPIALVLCDDQGRIIRFNKTTELLTGYVDDQSTWGRYLWDVFLHSEDASEVEAAFRRVFKEAFEGPGGPAILKEIKQGNPKVEGVPSPKDPTRETTRPVKLGVNVAYPDDAPFSSVPPSLLLKIPVLPPEVRYRFVGRALIARDTEANVILDFIGDIVPDPTIPR